jgi:hypothetical protein
MRASRSAWRKSGPADGELEGKTRQECFVLEAGRGYEITAMHDDKSEGWRWLKVME